MCSSCRTAASAASTRNCLIVYLHGFNSSPQSHKAQVMQRSWQSAASREFACPALPPLAGRSDARDRERSCEQERLLIGSSLGGFYATYLAEKHGLRAVLINPAIDPHVGLRAYLGPQKNLHTGEPYELTEAHLREWQKLYVPRITPQPLPAARRDRRRGARLPQGGGALRGRRAGGDHRRRPQPAELPAAPAAHTRVLACTFCMRKTAS